VRKLACFGCPIYCSHYYKIDDGPYSGIELEGFEANAGFGFGSRFDIDYPPAIAKAHELLSKLGLDNDNVSVTLSWAYECYERGILSKKDLDGYELNWGDHETLMEFIEKIAYRKGFGDLLAEGAYFASKKIGKGSERYATTVKRQDMIESIRATVGWGLGIVVSTRGARHLDGAPTTEMQGASEDLCANLFGVPTCGNGLSYEGKAKLVFWFEQYKEVVDMLGMCYYTSYWLGLDLLGPQDYAKLLSAATGIRYTANELMMVGRKAHNVEKAFNTIHANFTRKDDYPPQRFMEEPIKTGRHKGRKIEKEKWDKLLDEYYELQGWDRETGLQTEQCLRELGLYEVAERLKEKGKLLSI